jgi:hypothetical protein
VNHTTVSVAFRKAIHTLWPYGVEFGLPRRTRKKQQRLPVSYPEVKHVIYVAHALYRVCETIRILHSNVVKLKGHGGNLCAFAS